jgi:hypothetical protein
MIREALHKAKRLHQDQARLRPRDGYPLKSPGAFVQGGSATAAPERAGAGNGKRTL